jgi:hypothetical protein
MSMPIGFDSPLAEAYPTPRQLSMLILVDLGNLPEVTDFNNSWNHFT